jgi:hypothetical protein
MQDLSARNEPEFKDLNFDDHEISGVASIANPDIRDEYFNKAILIGRKRKSHFDILSDDHWECLTIKCSFYSCCS